MTHKMVFQVEGNSDSKSFSTFVKEGSIKGYGIHGYGNTALEAIADTYESIKEMRQLANSCGDCFPANIDCEFVLDIPSFFSAHPFISISSLANRLGINAALMRKYASGITHPSAKRIEEIQSGIHAIAKELQSVSLS